MFSCCRVADEEGEVAGTTEIMVGPEAQYRIGFLKALQSEYVDLEKAAVGTFLDGVPPDVAKIYVQLEDQVRDSANARAKINSIACDWCLDPPGSSAEKVDSVRPTKNTSKGKGKQSDKPPDLQRIEGLPVLPAQLEMMDGSWDWIRHANDRRHRQARLEAGRETQEALKAGGYGLMRSGNAKPILVRFTCCKQMLADTRTLSVSKGLPDLTTDPKHTTEYRYGGNPIEQAVELCLQGYNVATVNAASAYHAGGGFTSGGRHALEEAFCSQSTLYLSLEKTVKQGTRGQSMYIPEDGVVLSPDVEIFRRGSDQGYSLQTEAVRITAVISLAMYNLNSEVRDSPLDAPAKAADYEGKTRRKLKAMVHAAAFAGADAMIVPDVGCGVFGNDPALVGRLIGDVLKDYKGRFRKLVFTGKQKFTQVVSETLGVTLARQLSASTIIGATHRCVECGKALGNSSALSLLLTSTGRRSGGLQFLHNNCVDARLEKRPEEVVMPLPQVTAEPKSFLKALDVDGNNVLSKAEMKSAAAALWRGDSKAMEKEFNEKFKRWDKDQSGVLKIDELEDVPNEFLQWMKSSGGLKDP